MTPAERAAISRRQADSASAADRVTYGGRVAFPAATSGSVALELWRD